MSASHTSSPTLADVVTAAEVLEQDESRTREAVEERDHRIGCALGPDLQRDNAPMEWLAQVRDESRETDRLHEQLNLTTTWSSVALAVLGLIAGWLTTLGVFFFDGSGRVNAVAVVAIFVLLPALFLLLFLIAALPPEWVSRIPGVTALGALAGGLSPGRLTTWIVRLLPETSRQAWQQFAGQAKRHKALYSGLRKWVMLQGSQLVALMFQIGAVSAALILVIFTDLAFGWSTTLTSGDRSRDVEILHGITTAMATPWSWAVESAVPSRDLILESRYFRAADAALNPEQAARLGAWWPFMIACIFVYGLVPRLVTLAYAQSRLNSNCRRILGSLPGFSSVFHRLRHASIQTTSSQPENGRSFPSGESPPLSPPKPVEHELVAAVVNWSAVPVSEGSVQSCFGDVPVYPAGGALSLEQDRALAVTLAGEIKADSAVGILVKAWEPPLMEWIDFVEILHKALPKHTMIFVFPVGPEANGSLSNGSVHHTKIWSNKVVAQGDPYLQVAAIRQGVSS